MMSKVLTIKNRLFAKNGHDCQIPSSIRDLPMFQQQTTIVSQVKNALTRFRMCSEINHRAIRYLQTQKKIEQERRNHLKHLFVFHPFSDFREYWELFMLFVLLFVFVMFPLDICFLRTQAYVNFARDPGWRITKFVADITCLVDVLISFLTGYREKYTVVMDPKKIALHYLYTYFFFDLVSSIPSDSALLLRGYWGGASYLADEIIMYLSVLKIFRLRTFAVYWKNASRNFQVSYTTYRLSIAAIMYLLYYHVMTCIGIYLLNYDVVDEANNEKPIARNVSDIHYNILMSATYTYFYLLYETCAVIGNSDYLISDNVNKYVLASTIIWLISNFVYMYVTAVTIQMVECKIIARYKYDRLTNELSEFMKHKQMPVYLQKRIWTYFEFQFQRRYFREEQILSGVSSTLRQDIQMHSCKKLVENVIFFRDLPMSFLMKIVTVLHHETFMTNDVILKANTFGDCMYFLATGTVAVYTRTGREICHLTDGNHFGEIALVVKTEKRIASVVATECSEMYRLDRRDFTRALMPYPDLVTRIRYIASERKEETDALDDRNAKGDAILGVRNIFDVMHSY